MKCTVKGCKEERFVRKDGKVLEMCYDHAGGWCQQFEQALLSPQFVKALSRNVAEKTSKRGI